MGVFRLSPVLGVKSIKHPMEREEKDIRFIARFYREDRLNTTHAWQKLGISKKKSNSIPIYIKVAAVAAILCLVAGAGWWWNYDKEDWVIIASSPQGIKEVTLPDNSHITLDENTTLRYDRLAYGKKNRTVKLNGKAYFSVTHQEECPFCVETQLANIQVLGTRFQVTARAERTSATVESGKVRFYNQAHEQAILTRGMHASINKEGKMEVETESNPNAFAWRTRVLVYNETPLKEVVKELEKVYKVRIGHVPEKEYRLTASFDNTPIEEIISVINQTLDTKLDLIK